MEILPHFWISYYKNNINLSIIKKKNIKYIIHISKNESYLKKNIDIEEIRTPIDYNDNHNYEEQNNIMYEQLYDITEYIHNKIINNSNILLLGYEFKQDLETIIVAYFIRYGKLNIRDSILFLKTKKEDIFQPKCLFYSSLNKFYENCLTNNKI
jgi:hypothetical protein